MQAWLLPKLGSIDTLTLTQVPTPTPGPNEVLLNVKFAALNPADRYLAEGQYPAKPTFPHILGRDGVGTIAALGPNVTSFHLGQTVMIQRGDAGTNKWGTFAEQVIIPADALSIPPADWSLEQAAGASLVYITALQALTQFPDLPSPALVLITGASGGVGVAAIQLAQALGHTIVALSRGTAKHDALRSLGASITLDITDTQWRRQLRAATQDKRIDLAIDSIGGTLFPEIIETLAVNGRISLVGRLAGPVPNFNTATLFFRRLQLRGCAIAAYTPPETHTAWHNVVALLAQTNARPLVDQIFNFDQLPLAFTRLAQGPLGKVLLRVT